MSPEQLPPLPNPAIYGGADLQYTSDQMYSYAMQCIKDAMTKVAPLMSDALESSAEKGAKMERKACAELCADLATQWQAMGKIEGTDQERVRSSMEVAHLLESAIRNRGE
jgi:hypothetical protein